MYAASNFTLSSVPDICFVFVLGFFSIKKGSRSIVTPMWLAYNVSELGMGNSKCIFLGLFDEPMYKSLLLGQILQCTLYI